MTTTEPTPEAVEELARVIHDAHSTSDTGRRCFQPPPGHRCPEALAIARVVLAAGYVKLGWEATHWYRLYNPYGELWAESTDLVGLQRQAQSDDWKFKRLWHTADPAPEWRDFDPESGS